jgi:hypothetical protein
LLQENFRIVKPVDIVCVMFPDDTSYTVVKHILIAMDKWFAGGNPVYHASVESFDG